MDYYAAIKKEQITDICNNVNESQNTLLCERSYMHKSILYDFICMKF